MIGPPHTYVAYPTQAMISSVKQSKANVTRCLHRTRAAQQNTTEVIIISDAVYTGCYAVYTGCCAAQQISWQKTAAAFYLGRIDKFQMIFNSRFIASSVGRL